MSTLNLVLLFPMMFILHDVEEILVQHRWILSHRERLMLKFPSMRSMVEHLSHLNTRAFALAAAEELLLIVLATGYVLSDGAYGVEIWSALFMAFFIHLWVHLLQAVMVRGYVPGLINFVPASPLHFYHDEKHDALDEWMGTHGMGHLRSCVHGSQSSVGSLVRNSSL